DAEAVDATVVRHAENEHGCAEAEHDEARPGRSGAAVLNLVVAATWVEHDVVRRLTLHFDDRGSRRHGKRARPQERDRLRALEVVGRGLYLDLIGIVLVDDREQNALGHA